MTKSTLFIFILFLLTCCHSTKPLANKQTLYSNELHAIGRTNLSPSGLELISSASHFGFSYSGKTCSLYVSIPSWLSHNYIQYTINGEYIKRIRINRGASLIMINGGREHNEVWIYKATEAHTGPVFINKINANGPEPIIPAEKPMIEFIGNSITCGAASDTSDIGCGKGVYHDQHNAYMAYGPRVARTLGTHFILSSVSGIGIYRNWNSDGPSMPEVYEKRAFHPADSFWNFKTYEPSIISIALGTNDLSRGDGVKPRQSFDSARFVNEYVKFVKKVHSTYPGAQIALLSSPMMQNERRTILENCISAVKQQVDPYLDSPVAIYFFQPMKPGGCTGHPSVKDHEVMANELIPFFKQLLNK